MPKFLKLFAVTLAAALLFLTQHARAGDDDVLIPDRCPEPCEVGGRFVSDDYQRLTVPFWIRNGESGKYLTVSGRSVSAQPLVVNDDSFLWVLLPGPDLRFSVGSITEITGGNGFEERAYKLVNLKSSMALMSSSGASIFFQNGIPVHTAATHLGDNEFWLFKKEPGATKAASKDTKYLIYNPKVSISQPQYMYEEGARGNISKANASPKTMPALMQGRGQSGVYVQPGADFGAAGFTWQFEEVLAPRDLAKLTIKSVKAVKVSTGMDENTDILLKSVKYAVEYGPMVVSLGQTAAAKGAAKGIAAGAKAAGQGVKAGGKAAAQGAKSFGAGLGNWWKNRGKNEIADAVVKESLRKRLINGTMTIASAPFRGLSWLAKTTAKGAVSGSKKFVKLGAAAARGAPRVAKAGYAKAAAGATKGKNFVVGYVKKNPNKIEKTALRVAFKQDYKRVIRPLMSDVVEDSDQPEDVSPAEAKERSVLESRLRWSGNRKLVLSDGRDATYAEDIVVSARNYEVCQETKDYAIPQRNPPYFRIASTQNIEAIAEEAKTLSDTMEGQDGGAVAAKVGMVALDLLMFDVSPILDEITKAAAKVDDQLTIKVDGTSVWPNGGPGGDRGWRDIGSGQTKDVGVEYIFQRGDDVRIDLEEYDSGSSNDSLGNLTISTHHLYDIEEYEGAYIQETSEGSLYEVNFIVEPLYVPTPSEVERKKLHDVECAPVIAQAKAESFAREVELVRLDGRLELLGKYGEEALRQYDRTVEWADFNACPSSQNYYDILDGEWRVGRYDKDGNEDRSVTWTNTFTRSGGIKGEIITPSQDGKWDGDSLTPGRQVQKYGKDGFSNSSPKWTWQPFEDGAWQERKHTVDTCEIYAAMYDKDGLLGGRGREIFPYGEDEVRTTAYYDIKRELSFAIRGDISGGRFNGVVNQIADKSSTAFKAVNYLQDYYRDQAVPANQDRVDSNLYLTASGPAEFWLEKIVDTPAGQRAGGGSGESQWAINRVEKTIAGSWQIAPYKQGTEYPQQADPAIKRIWTFTTDGIFIEKPENDFWFYPPISGTWKYIGDQRIEVTTNRPVRIPVDPDAPENAAADKSELGKTFIVKMAQKLGEPTEFTGFFVQDSTGAKAIWSKALHPGMSPYEMPQLYSDAFFELLELKSKASGALQANLAKRNADAQDKKAKRQAALAQLLSLKSKSPCNMERYVGPGRTAFQGKWRVGQFDAGGAKKYAWNYKKMSSPYSEREQKREPKITSWRPNDVTLAENERDAFVWETDYISAGRYQQEWEFPADGKITVRTRLGSEVGYDTRYKKGEEAYPTARFDHVEYSGAKRAFVMNTNSNWVQRRDREDFKLTWKDRGCDATAITLPDSEGGTREYRANFIYHENGNKEFYLTHPDGSLYLWGQQEPDRTRYTYHYDNKILTPEQVASECRLDMPSSATGGGFPYSYVDENIHISVFMLRNEGQTPVRVYREGETYQGSGKLVSYHSNNIQPGGYLEFKANPTEKVAFLDNSKIIKFDNKEGVRYIDRFEACIGSKLPQNQFNSFVFGKGFVRETKQTDALTSRLNCSEYTPADGYPGRHAVVTFENKGSNPLEIWRLNNRADKISPEGKARISSPGDDPWNDANRYAGIEPIVTLEPGQSHELKTRVGYAFTAIRPGTRRMGQEYRKESGRIEDVLQGKTEECFGEIKISEASEAIAFSDELSHDDFVKQSDKRKKDRQEEKRVLNNLGLVSDTNLTPDTISESASAGTPVGITAFAVDGDVGDVVSYSVGYPFKIDEKTGVVMVNTPLDREAKASHTFTVTATSGGGAISTKEFVVAVEDFNEFDVSAVTTFSEKWVKKSETSRNYQRVTLDDNHEVSEGAAVGSTVILTAVAEDKDATNNTVRFSLSDNAGGLFAIDPVNGEVKTARALDYETAKSHSIVVVATSADGSSSSKKVSIVVLNANDADVGPMADADPAPNAVAEGVPTGTPVGITVRALDPDTGDTITYKRPQCSGCENFYDVNPVTGVVTTSSQFNQIDLEGVWTDPFARGRIAEAGRLRVMAESSDGSTSQQEFKIDILDAEEFQIGRTYDDDDALDQVAENAAIGTPVGVTAKAIDQDAKSTISYKLTDNSGGRFRIDPESGIITVAGKLDAEIAQSHAVKVVSTSNDGSTSARDIEIRISDVNESSIGPVVDIDKAPNTIVEASGSTGSRVIHLAFVGITAQAIDKDASSKVSYSLKGGNLMDRRNFGREGQSYISEHISIDVETGVVSAWGEGVDFEATPIINFTVIATSDDGSTSQAEFKLDVVNVNEYKVSDLKDANPAPDEVAENSPIGTPVGITATAIDGDNSDKITYALKDSSNGLFAIDQTTGIVTVAGKMDAEKAERHYLTIKATSSDGSGTEKNFGVIVTDVNEFDVAWKKSGYTSRVSEHAAIGDLVNLGSYAFDSDPSDTVTYALTNSHDVPFFIDPNSGQVTVRRSLRQDNVTSYVLELVASSTDGSQAHTSVEILVEGVNDFQIGALSDSDAAPNAVYEDAQAGTLVGITAFASDQDGTDAITYSLSGNYLPFAIDPATGVITVSNNPGLDAETKPVETVQISAKSSDGSQSWLDVQVTINDANEFKVGRPYDTDKARDEVEENAPYGTRVGITAFAEDLDVSDTVTYRFLQQGDDDYYPVPYEGSFAIDPITGVITVAGPIDYETAWTMKLPVLAVSSDGSPPDSAFSTPITNFEIRILPVNEFDLTPFVDTNDAPNEVAQSAGWDTPVGITLATTDADEGNVKFLFESVDANGNYNSDDTFRVDSDGSIRSGDPAKLKTLQPGPFTLYVKASSNDGSTRTEPVVIDIIGPERWYNNPQGPRVEGDFQTVSDADRQSCVEADDNLNSPATFNNEVVYFDCLENAVPVAKWRDNPQGPRNEADYLGVVVQDALDYCRYNDEEPSSPTFNNENAYFDCLDPYLPVAVAKWRDNPQGPRYEAAYLGVVAQDAIDYCRYNDEEPSSATFNNESAYFDCLDPYLPVAAAPVADAKWRDNPQGPRYEAAYLGVVAQDAIDYCRYNDEEPSSATFNNESAYFDCLDPYLPVAAAPVAVAKWRDNPQGPRYEQDYLGVVSQEAINYCRYYDEEPTSDTYNNENAYFNCLDPYRPAVNTNDGGGEDPAPQPGNTGAGDALACANQYGMQAEYSDATGLITLTNSLNDYVDVYQVNTDGSSMKLTYVDAGQSTEITVPRMLVYVGLDSQGNCVGAGKPYESRNDINFAAGN